jgi:hypothetical protein
MIFREGLRGVVMSDSIHRNSGCALLIFLILVIGPTALGHNQGKRQANSKKPDVVRSTGVLLMAQAARDVVAAGEPVTLTLTITNESKTTRFIWETSATEQYRLIVLDGRGKPASVTPYGEKELRPREDHLARHLRGMEPGEQSRDTIEVNKLFEMSSPGTYSISAARTIYDRKGKGIGTVHSNSVSVNVTQ